MAPTKSIPEAFKAAVIADHDKYVFEIQDVAMPVVGPNDVLVRLSATGICGTDVMLASGKMGPTCSILGHEGVGRVVKVGSAIESAVQLGQRVGVSWVRDWCGDCTACLHEGGETRCFQRIYSGQKVDGTLAEYTIVPHRYLLRLPEGPADELLAPIMCAGVTAYKAIKVSGAIPGQWIAIPGAGGAVGAMAIQYGRAMGYKVLAIGGGKQKGEHCMELGADAYLDFTEESDLTSVSKDMMNGIGASAVLVAAGSVQAYQMAFNIVAPFGTIVCIGIPAPTAKMQLHPLEFIDNGISIIGTVTGTRADILEAVEFVKNGTIIPKAEVVPIADVSTHFQLCASGKASTKYIVRLAEENS